MASPFSPTAPPSAAPATERAAVRDPAGAPPPPRALGRRPSLPGGRALIGAALVVAAAVLTYAAYLGATAAPTQTYVVADRDLQVNDRVTAGDLRVVTGDLPPDVAAQAFRSPAELDGAVVLAPLGRHALVPRTAVLARDQAATRSDGYEVSFTVPNWKLGGDRLQLGELIDIVPLGDTRDAARPTAAPVPDVRVVALAPNGGGGLASASGSGETIVSVSAADTASYLAIVGAVRNEFWVVRSTRAPDKAAPALPALPSLPSLPGPTTTAPPLPSGLGVSVPTSAAAPAATSGPAAGAPAPTTARRP
jgi:hypothetical protein